MNKKLISFSIYGPYSLYNDGAYENIQEASEYFPGWICRFYCAKDSPILSKLLEEQDKGRCEVVVKDPEKGIKGMFWRLEAISDPDADYIIIRDTDQRLSDKDFQAVNDWINSGLNAHRMHEDTSQWKLVLMGCAWGIKGGVVPNVNKLIDGWLDKVKNYTVGHEVEFNQNNETKILYGADQLFLKDEIWPIICNSCKTYGILGDPFPDFRPLKWGDKWMFRRISPNTNCTKIFGNRPDYAYIDEEK